MFNRENSITLQTAVHKETISASSDLHSAPECKSSSFMNALIGGGSKKDKQLIEQQKRLNQTQTDY